MSTTSGVYAVRHRSGAAYIGSSKNVERRLRTHEAKLRRGQHSNVKLQALWSSSSELDFEFVLIEQCPIDMLYRLEQSWLDRQEVAPLNMAGRVSVSSLDPSVAQRIGDTLRGKPKPEGFGAKVSAAQKGVACPARSAAQKGKPRPWQVGTKRSAETRAKMAEAALGNQNGRGAKHPRASVERRRRKVKGQTRTADAKARMRRSQLAYQAAMREGADAMAWWDEPHAAVTA